MWTCFWWLCSDSGWPHGPMATFFMKLCTGGPSHNKTDVNKFASGKGRWDFTADGTMGKVINQVTKVVQERVPFLPRGTDSWICARGSGVVKHWKQGCLAPHWKGPCTVVLASPTAVKVAGITPWFLHMRMKRAYYTDLEDAKWTIQKDCTDPCETKIILKKKRWSSTINCCYKDLLVSSWN